MRALNMKESFASLVILFFLSAQGFAVFGPPLPDGSYLWPFLNYPMYRQAFKENGKVERHVLYGVLEDGSRVRIFPGDLGLTHWKLRAGLIKPWIRKNKTERLPLFARIYEKRTGTRLAGFRLENHPLVVGKAGVLEGAPEILSEFKFHGAAS